MARASKRCREGNRFGKGAGWTVGLTFVGLVFWPVLGFGSAVPTDPCHDESTPFAVAVETRDARSFLETFVHGIEERVGERSRFVPELDAYLVVTKRFVPDCLTNTGHAPWVAEGRGELRRAAPAPFLNPAAVSFAKEKPKGHFAAFDLLMVVDSVTGDCETLERTPVWGFAMWKGIKQAGREAIGL